MPAALFAGAGAASLALRRLRRGSRRHRRRHRGRVEEAARGLPDVVVGVLREAALDRRRRRHRDLVDARAAAVEPVVVAGRPRVHLPRGLRGLVGPPVVFHVVLARLVVVEGRALVPADVGHDDGQVDLEEAPAIRTFLAPVAGARAIGAGGAGFPRLRAILEVVVVVRAQRSLNKYGVCWPPAQNIP